MFEIFDLTLKFEKLNENDSVALLKIVSIPFASLFFFHFFLNLEI